MRIGYSSKKQKKQALYCQMAQFSKGMTGKTMDNTWIFYKVAGYESADRKRQQRFSTKRATEDWMRENMLRFMHSSSGSGYSTCPSGTNGPAISLNAFLPT